MSFRLIYLSANCTTCSLNRNRLFDAFFVTGMRRWQLINFQNVHAEVANPAETQSGEPWDSLAHPPENIFD